MLVRVFRRAATATRTSITLEKAISLRHDRALVHVTGVRLSTQHQTEAGQQQEAGAQQERPDPRRPQDMNVEKRGIPKGKIFLLAVLGSSIGYSYYTYDEKKFEELGVTVATEDPKLTIQKVFGFWILNWAKLRQSYRDFIKYFSEPPKPLLLPSLDLPPNAIAPLTLVLDLDETLVHTEWDRTHGARTRRRPYVREFLQRLASMGVEIVIFSSASMFYTDGIVAALDPKGQFIHHRLGKEYTLYQDGKYIKDLSRLNRDLSRVVIMDDNPEAYSMHPHNAVPITKWTGDRSDTALRDLMPFFEFMAQGLGNSITDVRAELHKYEGANIPELFRQKAEERAKKQQKIATLLGGRSLLHRPTTQQQQKQQQAPAPQQPQTPSSQQQTQQTQQSAGQSSTQQPQSPQAPQQEQGSLWKWLQRKNEESALREQQKQEEWNLRQQEKSKKN